MATNWNDVTSQARPFTQSQDANDDGQPDVLPTTRRIIGLLC
jgi:hypothetical protein